MAQFPVIVAVGVSCRSTIVSATSLLVPPLQTPFTMLLHAQTVPLNVTCSSKWPAAFGFSSSVQLFVTVRRGVGLAEQLAVAPGLVAII